MADASNSHHAVKALLTEWTACGRLSYKFRVTPASSARDTTPCMLVTFSKPSTETPAPEAVARLYFHLSEDHQRVRGFTVEQDPHFHDLTAVKFDESVLDRVIRRKLQLQSAHLVDLSDEFASTRVPSVMRAREEKQREHDRETMEEYLLEQMQHADSYNDGKLMIEAFRETIDALDLDSRVSPREVLLALATTDRDDMVDYGEFVSVAADMIDSMSGPAHGNNTAPNGETVMRIDDEDEALDAFEMVSARQTHYTVEKLSALLEAHAERVTTAANAMAARRAAAEIDAKQEATTTILEETNEGDNEDEDEADGEKVARDTSPDEMATDTEDGVNESGLSRRESSATDRRTSSLQQQLHMPRYQLRTLLETPQLLLSQAEINLILALAQTKTDVNGVEEVLCEDLGSLLRRVRRMIFCFQRKGFVDRTEKYLLNQFQSFEKTNLQGSARHLKHRLTQKEVKAAVKKMQKLLISPYQLMQLLALSEEQTDAPEHIVHYQEFIPRMARHMEELVSLDILAEKSSLLHGMHLGVIPIGDFRKALKQLAEQHDFTVGTLSEMKQLTVLADPNGSGRVNYAYFQHLMYPLMRLLLQERELAAARDEARTQCG
ncbi:hypothetical protein BBP00_00000642 [Phytophthora kernoviae]|uniref:Uncharacterized protein n=1 Tax=Phytophthora kernoviae TaxID=325452 RepID=A0A3F2S2I8_9STRA|nr:hypothetical protein BBP00_00000642 [Phytophthora kernoviae]